MCRLGIYLRCFTMQPRCLFVSRYTNRLGMVQLSDFYKKFWGIFVWKQITFQSWYVLSLFFSNMDYACWAILRSQFLEQNIKKRPLDIDYALPIFLHICIYFIENLIIFQNSCYSFLLIFFWWLNFNREK